MMPSAYHPERICVECNRLVYDNPHVCRKVRHPIPRSGKPIKKRNLKRKRESFARCYGSKARVEFVKSLPCAACGVVGYSENAHLLGNGGMGRKADANTIGPLCSERPMPQPELGEFTWIGCHCQYDRHRWAFDRWFPDFDPERVARETEDCWLEASHD